MKLKVKFVPQDLWVGVFWKKEESCLPALCDPVWVTDRIITVYVCIIPCFPIIMEFWERTESDHRP